MEKIRNYISDIGREINMKQLYPVKFNFPNIEKAKEAESKIQNIEKSWTVNLANGCILIMAFRSEEDAMNVQEAVMHFDDGI